MGKLLCTGDTHRDDVARFEPYRYLTKNDVMVICGDWGALWYGGKEDDAVLDRWEDYGFTTFVVLGNHENYDLVKNYPIVWCFGAPVRRIRPHVFVACNGEVYDINGAKCFTMGGAPSIDKYMRKEHISWWKEEIPDYSDFVHGLDRLDENNWDIDYVFSHEAPDTILTYFGYEHNVVSNFLEIVHERLINNCPRFKHHYFGHHHIDKTFTIYGNKDFNITHEYTAYSTCLFHRVEELKI